MAWAALVFAGVFEIGWPVGLKLAQNGGTRVIGISIALVFMVLSGFLWTAQKQIPIGTAYAVWTGIGAAGAFLVGAAFYGETVSLVRFSGVGLIIGGVIVLKLAH